MIKNIVPQKFDCLIKVIECGVRNSGDILNRGEHPVPFEDTRTHRLIHTMICLGSVPTISRANYGVGSQRDTAILPGLIISVKPS